MTEGSAPTGPAEPENDRRTRQGHLDDPPVGEASGPGDALGAAGLTEAQLEALLFVAERPLGRREIATLAGVDASTVDARLGDLEVSLGSRGIRLLIAGERVALVTAPEAGRLIARYVGADAIRLSPAALETLAIVAYRQPVTRAAIERIRGVDSDYTVRGLLHRRLVVEIGRAEAPGRPFLYGTGQEFLERFGLTSLEELPPLEADVDGRLLEAVDAAMDERFGTSLAEAARVRAAGSAVGVAGSQTSRERAPGGAGKGDAAPEPPGAVAGARLGRER